MDFTPTFVQNFCRLAWLLAEQPGEVDAQKASLRAAMVALRPAAIELEVDHWQLSANGVPQPDNFPGVRLVVESMVGHGVRCLTFGAGAPPGEILHVVKLLNAPPAAGAPMLAFETELRMLAPKSVSASYEDTAIKDVSPVQSAPAAAPALAPPPNAVIPEEEGSSYLLFAAKRTPQRPSAELLEQLAATTSANAATRMLDDLTTLAESLAQAQKSSDLVDIFVGVLDAQAKASSGDLQRAFQMGMRKLTRPTLLQPLLPLFLEPNGADPRVMRAFKGIGEMAEETLLEAHGTARAASHRKAYVDALIALEVRIDLLVHLLGDARWYVARDAAELLGERRAIEAEGALIDLKKHADQRVHRAGLLALGKLGTARALQALRLGLQDDHADVRSTAAQVLAGLHDASHEPVLIKALDDEVDPSAQKAMMQALGKLATPASVERLVDAAKPATGLFRRKSSDLRVAAVQALADARTPAAMAAVKRLENDKDEDVREAVKLVTMIAERRTGAFSRISAAFEEENPA
jgi:HEAT repeats